MEIPKRFIFLDEYRTGNQMIDTQHEALFERINVIIEDLENLEEKPVVRRHINFLVTYVNNHFTDEESLMRSCGYPKLDAQKAAHEELRVKTLEYLDRFDEDKLNGVEMIYFLKQWLDRHIKVMDADIARFIAGKTE